MGRARSRRIRGLVAGVAALGATALLACTSLLGLGDLVRGVDDAASGDSAFPLGDGAGGSGAAGADTGTPARELSAEYTPGTRLHPNWLTTADGTRTFSSWYDTSLHFSCTFQEVPGGTLRCIPPFTFGGQFSDTGCSQPAVLIDPCSAPALAVITLGPATDCAANPVSRVQKIGAAITTSTYSYQSNGVCTSTAIPAGLQLFGLADLPLDSLAAGTLVRDESSAGRIVPVFEVGADGSRGFHSLVDRTFDAGCAVAEAPLGSGIDRCFTGATVVNAGENNASFTDMGCTSPLVSLGACTAAGSPVRVVTRDAGCVSDDYFGVGPEAGSVYQSHGGAMRCNSGGSPGPTDHALGPHLDLATLPSADASLGASAARVVPREVEFDGQLRVQVGFWDTLRQESCSFQEAADGTTRCLPPSVSSQTSFSDNACNKSASFVAVSGCARDPAPGYAREQSGSGMRDCVALRKLYAVTPAPIATYTSVPNATPPCVQGVMAYKLGSEVPSSTFEGATLTYP